jgi:predicted ATPase/class 3 adenylate cyclase
MGSVREGDPPSGEVTFLFTDIEGSTRLYQRLGDAFERILDRHRQLCRQAFTAHDGLEVACPGDGFTVAFSRSADAVAAAVDAQRALAAEPWPEAVPVRVRMGVHTGPVRLTSTGGTYMGMTVHEAARVGGLAQGGQILLTEATLRSLGTEQLPTRIEAVSLGSHVLRDIAGPRQLFELRGSGLPRGFELLSTAAPATNLPAVGDLLGRTDDLTAAAAAFGRSSLVTVVGPGGVGKTSLALALAHREHQDGRDAWFVDLAPSAVGSTADEVATVVGAALGLDVDGGVAGLAASLEDRTACVVLDNCEHVLAAAAAVAEEVLRRAPSVKVLATSRERLGLAGEAVVPLAPLDPSAARSLFLERATDAAPTAPVGSDLLPVVDRICERVDRLPLAIELAARRVSVLGVVEIDARLEQRFDLLTAGARGAPSRQQTLEATIEWSHSLLDADEQALLRRLSVFAGGWDLPAAEAVCGGTPLAPERVLDLLASLVDRSLVTVQHVEGVARYSLLETVRAFAADRLAAEDERTSARHGHLAYYADRSWEHLEALGRGQGVAKVRTMTADADNLRGAVEWALAGGDPRQGLRAAAAAAVHGMEAGGIYYAASAGWIDRLLATGAADDDPALRGQALVSRANVAVAQGDLERVARCSEEAMALAVRYDLGDAVRSQAWAMAGISALGQDPRRAVAMQRRAAELAGASGWAGFRVYVLGFLSTAALLADELEDARIAAETGLAEARGLGLGVGIARALNCLSDVHLREADVTTAAELAAEAAATAEAARAAAEVGSALNKMAAAAFLGGDTDAAIRHVSRAADQYARLGQVYGAVRTWSGAVMLTAMTGSVELAGLALGRLAETVDPLDLTEPQLEELQRVVNVARAVGLDAPADDVERAALRRRPPDSVGDHVDAPPA